MAEVTEGIIDVCARDRPQCAVELVSFMPWGVVVYFVDRSYLVFDLGIFDLPAIEWTQIVAKGVSGMRGIVPARSDPR